MHLRCSYLFCIYRSDASDERRLIFSKLTGADNEGVPRSCDERFDCHVSEDVLVVSDERYELGHKIK